jgi:hypothetical protein
MPVTESLAQPVPFWTFLVHNTDHERREETMAVNVKLSEGLVEQARHHGQVQHRSVPKQIEYWSRIGKVAEENPDLPFTMIRDILLAQQEIATEEYRFG